MNATIEVVSIVSHATAVGAAVEKTSVALTIVFSLATEIIKKSQETKIKTW